MPTLLSPPEIVHPSVYISGKPYTLTTLAPDSFRLESPRADYEVSREPSGRAVCSCPDFAYRHSALPFSDGCKHVKAMVDAGLILNTRPLTDAEWDAMAEDARFRELVESGYTEHSLLELSCWMEG